MAIRSPYHVKFWSVGNERYDTAYIHRVRDGAKDNESKLIRTY